MKKVKTAAALLCSACLVLSGTAVPTMADSVKVVTLGKISSPVIYIMLRK